MKRIVIILCGLIAACTSAPSGYVLEGTVRGAEDGLKITLSDLTDYTQPVVMDSAVIRNGKFRLTGRVAHPAFYRWTIDRTPAGQASDPRNYLSGTFYIENAEITFSGHIDSLPTYYWSKEKRIPPVITGSAMEVLNQQFNREMSSITTQRSKLNEELMEAYHLPSLEGVFNTAAGIPLARQLQSLQRQADKMTLDFIGRYPSTIVAFNKAEQLLDGGYVNLTVPRIDTLEALLAGAWSDRPEYVTRLRTTVAKARKVALGVKYPDIELINTAGEKVWLSSMVPEGKYVMLEFWASWCGPCRGEIPHLRHIYADYQKKGFEIISISIDQKREDWDKAVEQEQMNWPQLCDPAGFDGPVTREYNVWGVPTCILLDKEGRIFKTDMRGANLDAVLAELYD